MPNQRFIEPCADRASSTLNPRTLQQTSQVHLEGLSLLYAGEKSVENPFASIVSLSDPPLFLPSGSLFADGPISKRGFNDGNGTHMGS